MTKQELANKIWSITKQMRSKIKANEYKDYILGFMFYKFLSDKEEVLLEKEGLTPENVVSSDSDVMNFAKDGIGYAIEYKNLFSTWKNADVLLDAKTVSEGLDAFNKNIKPVNKRVFENIFDTLHIYEFLIYKFATAAKDDGAFYTPHEVSQLISMIVAEHCKNCWD